MEPKEHWPRRVLPRRGPDGRFEQLRDRFYQRLCDDARELELLRAELQGRAADAPPSYEPIRLLAHRICGAASIYEDAAIRDAASSLEWAAFGAMTIIANNQEEVLRAIAVVLAVLSPLKERGNAIDGASSHCKV
jgi:hypothetical protein